MAKLLLSSSIADVRGAVAGTVFQQGLYGLQCGGKNPPINPQTQRTQEYRARFAYMSRLYRELSEAQRTEWINNAPSGWSGYAYFSSINAIVANQANTIAVVPPPPTIINSSGIELYYQSDNELYFTVIGNGLDSFAFSNYISRFTSVSPVSFTSSQIVFINFFEATFYSISSDFIEGFFFINGLVSSDIGSFIAFDMQVVDEFTNRITKVVSPVLRIN